ncbi:MAG: zinc ribbon domain-containing protein, partial [Ruminococcus sp.]|nr:zinc ribbon domain-containing protein [Ruminococcus sp.]
ISISGDYCKYCFSGGEFTKQMTMEEKMEEDISFWTEDGITPEEARAEMMKVFRTLKRWRENA